MSRPLPCENLVDDNPHRLQIADIRFIFAHSASAVTRNEKRSINTNRKSTIRAFQGAYDEHRTLLLRPQRVAQKREVSEISTLICDNFEIVTDRMSVSINH